MLGVSVDGRPLGESDGDELGWELGSGEELGPSVGFLLGSSDGESVQGLGRGDAVGPELGDVLGKSVKGKLGLLDGLELGVTLGCCVEGVTLGDDEGLWLGVPVDGLELGDDEGPELGCVLGN